MTSRMVTVSTHAGMLVSVTIAGQSAKQYKYGQTLR